MQTLENAVRLRHAGQLSEAEALLRDLCDRIPGDPRVRFALATVLLQQAKWDEAWPLYEARRALLPRRSLVPVTGREWLGEPIDGARVAVCAEQGFGDQIMFGRYLSELRRRGAEVTVAVTVGNAATLFESLGYCVTTATPGRQIAGVDLWTYFGSLPLRLGKSAPPAPEYIALPTTHGGGIGVVATGDPLNPVDRHRSLPPALADRLGRLGRDLRPQATGYSGLLETASLIAGLDLVVTVCTAVAHLSLSMGKRTIVLLSKAGMDFRWNDGRRSAWYPSAHLIRQARDGEWEDVLDHAEHAAALMMSNAGNAE